MLRSRRATPIQDIVDGTTAEDRTDRGQDHRLRIGAAEHLDGKVRACRERNRELGAIVGRSAGVEQQACIGGLLSLDTIDDVGPFALELAGILDRGGLGSTGGGNLSGIVELGFRCRRSGRRGSRSGGGLGRRSRCRLRRRRRRLGGRRRLGARRGLGRRSGGTAVPRHAALLRGRSGRGRSGSSGARDKRRLLGGSGRRCGRCGSLSSGNARRNGAVGDHGLQACHALGQGINR